MLRSFFHTCSFYSLPHLSILNLHHLNSSKLWLLTTKTLELLLKSFSHIPCCLQLQSHQLYIQTISKIWSLSITSVATILIQVTIICPLDYWNRLPTNPLLPLISLHPIRSTGDWLILSKLSQTMPFFCLNATHGTWKALHDPSPYLPDFISYYSHLLYSSHSGFPVLCEQVGHSPISRLFHLLLPVWMLLLQKSEWLVPLSLSDFTPMSLSHWVHLWSSAINLALPLDTSHSASSFCFSS